ncbi:hypothetical protein K1719_021928 [Acacia pycnantha]|nr:hypothetical protein K1719_021928 [Acacia pycnantha]
MAHQALSSSDKMDGPLRGALRNFVKKRVLISQTFLKFSQQQRVSYSESITSGRRRCHFETVKFNAHRRSILSAATSLPESVLLPVMLKLTPEEAKIISTVVAEPERNPRLLSQIKELRA